VHYKSLILVALVAFGVGYLTRTDYINIFSKPGTNELQGLERKIDIIAERLVSLEEEEKTLPPVSPTAKRPLKNIKDSEALKNVRWEPGNTHIDDPFFGPGDSDVVIMAFVDYLSESSRTFFVDTFKSIRTDYIEPRRVKFIVRDFPVVDEVRSLEAAKATHCAGEQGLYKEMSQHLILLGSNQLIPDYASEMAGLDPATFEQCLASKRYNSEAKFDREEGESLGVVGTPSFFLGRKESGRAYQGYLLRGAQPYKVFANLVERLLN